MFPDERSENRQVNEVSYTPVVVFLSDGSVLEFDEAWDTTYTDEFVTFLYKRNGRILRASFDLKNIAGVSVAV